MTVPPPKGEVAPPSGLLPLPKPLTFEPNPPNPPGEVLLFAVPKAVMVLGEVEPKELTGAVPPKLTPVPDVVAGLNPDPKGLEAPPDGAPKTGFVLAPAVVCVKSEMCSER